MRNLLVGLLFLFASGTLLATSDFVSVWQVDENDLQIVLPLPRVFSYDFVVDWGDGSRGEVTAWNDIDARHTYARAGTYTVTIYGQVEAWSFWKIPQSRNKIIAVTELGSVGWRSFFGAFLGCANLKQLAGGDTTQVTDMRYMFHAALNAVPDTSGWDTTRVTNMAGMFWQAAAANPDVGHWNTAAVTDMSFMFANTTTANPDVRDWDVARVTNMSNMFYRASAAVPDMRGWNFAQIANMRRIFWGLRLPTDVYSNILVQLAATSEARGVMMHGGYSRYNDAGAAARRDLVDRGWRLVDGGRAPDTAL